MVFSFKSNCFLAMSPVRIWAPSVSRQTGTEDLCWIKVIVRARSLILAWERFILKRDTPISSRRLSTRSLSDAGPMVHNISLPPKALLIFYFILLVPGRPPLAQFYDYIPPAQAKTAFASLQCTISI